MDTFNERIIGYDSIKQILRLITDILKRTNDYRSQGAGLPHGLLLVGKPGTGKSTMANALMQASGRTALTFRMDAEQNEFLDALKAAFENAVKHAPSVITLEDIHLYGQNPLAPEWPCLQACIDDCKEKDVFIIATANTTSRIPDSLLRPGRFDYVVNVDVPQGQTAMEIIRYYLRETDLAEDVNIEDVAKMLGGNSCAALESALSIAKINAIYDGEKQIHRKHLVTALMQVIHQMKKADKDYTTAEWRGIAIHEASHAVVCELLRPGHTAAVSILSSDEFIGGCTDIYEQGYSSEAGMLELATIFLAGKAGTEVLLGSFDIGAADDIQCAHNIVYTWVTKLAGNGFSYVESQRAGISEAGKREYELLIAAKMDECYNRAKQIIFDNRTFVERICDALLKEETLTLLSSDIQKIRQTCQ